MIIMEKIVRKARFSMAIVSSVSDVKKQADM